MTKPTRKNGVRLAVVDRKVTHKTLASKGEFVTEARLAVPASQVDPKTDRIVDLNTLSPRALFGYARVYPDSNLARLYREKVNDYVHEELSEVLVGKVIRSEEEYFDFLTIPQQQAADLVRRERDLNTLWNWFVLETEDLDTPRKLVLKAFVDRGFGTSTQNTAFQNGNIVRLAPVDPSAVKSDEPIDDEDYSDAEFEEEIDELEEED